MPTAPSTSATWQEPIFHLTCTCATCDPPVETCLYVCGSDEHGTAIPNQALKEHTTPTAIINKYHAQMRDAFKALGISFDIYHRTSEQIHHQTSQEIFLTLYNKGLLNEEVSEQYYDEEARAFLADRYIIGTCPKCGNPGAVRRQCEALRLDVEPT